MTPPDCTGTPYTRQQVVLGSGILMICTGLMLLWGQMHTMPLTADEIPCPTFAHAAGIPGIVDDHDPPPPTFKVLVRDDFLDAEASNVHTDSHADVEYVFNNGAYLIAVKKPGLVAWSLVDGIYHDIVIQVETAMVVGSSSVASGLIFRYQDDNNFYLFNVTSNGFYNLELLEHGTHMTLIDWTPSDAINTWHPNTVAPQMAGALPAAGSNRLRVDLRGEYITLFVNGMKVEETVDTTFRWGKVALAVNTIDTDMASICFDNMFVFSNTDH